VTPTNLPQRIAARLTGVTENLLRRLARRNLAKPPRHSLPKPTLGLALLGSSSIAAWCLLHAVEDSEDARPTMAMRIPSELELLPPPIALHIDPSLHDRSRTEDPERAPSNDAEAMAPSPTPLHPTNRVLPPPTPRSHDARSVPTPTSWSSSGTWRFQPGTTAVAFVTTRGLELRTLP
jgi:hypothetical protein